jgi:hypothetical protein
MVLRTPFDAKGKGIGLRVQRIRSIRTHGDMEEARPLGFLHDVAKVLAAIAPHERLSALQIQVPGALRMESREHPADSFETHMPSFLVGTPTMNAIQVTCVRNGEACKNRKWFSA